MSDENLVGAVRYLHNSETIIHLYQDEEFLQAEIFFAGEDYDQWMGFSEVLERSCGYNELPDAKAWVERWRKRAELIHASLYIQKDLADRLDD